MSDTNFSNSTPSAISGINIIFQRDATANPRKLSAFVTEADGSAKGVVQLAGDLYGTADAPLLHGPYDIGIPVIGFPDAGEIIRFTFTLTVTFPGDFAGSYAKSAAASAASAVFTVNKNGSPVGHATFVAASTGTFDTTGGLPVTFIAGDLFELVCPAVQDATWENGNFTFAGTR